MDLFNIETSPNLLPFDGEVNYYGRIMSLAEAIHYLQILLDTIAWKNDEAVISANSLLPNVKLPGMAMRCMPTVTPIPPSNLYCGPKNCWK